MSPFAIRVQIYGPQTRRDHAVWCITAALGIVVTLTVLAGLWIVLP